MRGTLPPRRRLSRAVRLHIDSPKGRGLIYNIKVNIT